MIRACELAHHYQLLNADYADGADYERYLFGFHPHNPHHPRNPRSKCWKVRLRVEAAHLAAFANHKTDGGIGLFFVLRSLVSSELRLL